MASLTVTLEQVRKKIEDYKTIYATGEEAVKNQLINPVLTSLGWDVENPERVRLNVPIGSGFADYALVVDGTPIAIIEAKNQNVELDTALDQAFKYGSKQGAKYVILTNGNEWRLYWTFVENVPQKDRLIWKVDIRSDVVSTAKALETIQRDDWNKLRERIEADARKRALSERWAQFVEDQDRLVSVLVLIRTVVVES